MVKVSGGVVFSIDWGGALNRVWFEHVPGWPDSRKVFILQTACHSTPFDV